MSVEGQWVDSNDNPLVFTKWRKNGPDNWSAEGEQYLMMGYEEDGVHRPVWNDMTDYEMSIVCEKGILSSQI